jgi:hypothetical protein
MGSERQKQGSAGADGERRERRRADLESDQIAAEAGRIDPSNKLKVTSVKGSVYGKVGRDDKGDAIWEWRVDVPLRRDEDETINLLKCLEDVDLELADSDDVAESKDPAGGYNPYNRGK